MLIIAFLHQCTILYCNCRYFSNSWKLQERNYLSKLFSFSLHTSVCWDSDFFGALLLSGLQTSQDARFYGISSKFDSFNNEGKDLVIQFTVKHEQKIDCGGGYVKVFPSDLVQADMHGDSPYNIMFGKKRGENMNLSNVNEIQFMVNEAN